MKWRWRRINLTRNCSRRNLEDKSSKTPPFTEISLCACHPYLHLFPRQDGTTWGEAAEWAATFILTPPHEWVGFTGWVHHTKTPVSEPEQARTLKVSELTLSNAGSHLSLSLLPCCWGRQTNSVELDDPGVRIQRAPEFRGTADPTDIAWVLQVKVTVGQQAAATHRDTWSLIPLLQVGDAERKADTYKEKKINSESLLVLRRRNPFTPSQSICPLLFQGCIREAPASKASQLRPYGWNTHPASASAACMYFLVPIETD